MAIPFLRLSLLLLSALLSGCLTTSETPPSRPAHHTDDGFQNPHLGAIGKSPWSFLKMKYFGDQPFADHAAQAHTVPVATPGDTHNKAIAKPQITWIGHSTFLIQYQGINILTDPMFSRRASPVSFAGPERLVELPIAQTELPEIDYVVISHNHYDHLDTDSILGLGDQTLFHVPLKLKAWFIELGIPQAQVMEFDWWDEWSTQSLKVVATPSQLWPARSLFD